MAIDVEKAEKQIEAEIKNIDYDTREFAVEYLVDKYLKDIDNARNELYVPEYQGFIKNSLLIY
ncbi:MAG: hypothetical protein GY862_32915 [Gammaproteobacteria bacterium]|nr:hypothetical protein [Gammaproteobacteria bacterium]